MRKTFERAEEYRFKLQGKFKTFTGDHFGLFIIPVENSQIRIIVDDGAETGWEHASVTCKVMNNKGEIENMMPPWDCMMMVKMMFWDDEECVLQFHPPESVYVGHDTMVLHLWRQVGVNHPLPPRELV